MTAQIRPHSALTRLRTTATRFRTDESGVLEKPMIVTLLSMLAVGGISMDVVRLERDRTHLQYTLDRAVLAAADLDQTLEPAAVVYDYMNKADLASYYSTPTAEVTPTSKRVSASVDADFETMWMKFASYDSPLPLKAAATAEEKIGNVEISLVLDVSGSMAGNNRLVNLKAAAKDFIQTMADNTEDGTLSISIIPYSTQVSMPAAFIDELNAPTPGGAGEEDYSYCINFENSDFYTTALSTTQEYERTMHFSLWGGNREHRQESRLVQHSVCASDADNPERTAVLLEDDVATLQDYIDDFEPSDNTSLDIGMKWGVALLDPSTQPVISALTSGSDPQVDPSFANRPVSYSDTDTLKVVVLMTDGQNTDQYYIQPGYRTGKSGVWYNPEKAVYSTYDSDNNRYFWHNVDQWSDHPYGAGTDNYYVCTYSNWYGCQSGYWATEGGSAEELTFASLYANSTLHYVYYLYADWMDRYQAAYKWFYDVFGGETTSTKDTRTLAVCDAAKDQDIMVFTIGFEAPAAGQEVLLKCASSDSHYYDVEGLEIADAFASIASAIRQLRLTE